MSERTTHEASRDVGQADEERAEQQRMDESRLKEPQIKEERPGQQSTGGGGSLSTVDLVQKSEHGSGTDSMANRRSGDGHETPLIPDSQSGQFRGRWTDIQGKFVDDPKTAVQEADSLVAEVIQIVARSFSDERSNLENQWQSGGEVSTEELRVSLQRYRSFFNRLLNA
jgi:hypothetical protein